MIKYRVTYERTPKEGGKSDKITRDYFHEDIAASEVNFVKDFPVEGSIITATGYKKVKSNGG